MAAECRTLAERNVRSLARSLAVALISVVVVVLTAAAAWPAAAHAYEDRRYDYNGDANSPLVGSSASVASTASEASIEGPLGPPAQRSEHIYDVSRSQVAPSGLGDDLLGGLRQCFRSFSGETEVLMADGTTKPISEIEVGDWVLAEDPEAGERGARQVTQLWVHQDLIIDLEIDGHDIATTEDHPFWNHTDREWQRADAIDSGDLVLTANGSTITVDGMDWASARTTTAYNLSVDGIHTYFVAAGHAHVLVHNTGCDEAAEIIQREIGGDIRTFRPPDGVPFLGQYRLANEAWSHHTVVVSNGRVYDQFTGSAGVPIDDWKALWTHADAIDFGF